MCVLACLRAQLLASVPVHMCVPQSCHLPSPRLACPLVSRVPDSPPLHHHFTTTSPSRHHFSPYFATLTILAGNFLHSGHNHLPTGSLVNPTHSQWNHSYLHASLSHATIFPWLRLLHVQYTFLSSSSYPASPSPSPPSPTSSPPSPTPPSPRRRRPELSTSNVPSSPLPLSAVPLGLALPLPPLPAPAFLGPPNFVIRFRSGPPCPPVC